MRSHAANAPASESGSVAKVVALVFPSVATRWLPDVSSLPSGSNVATGFDCSIGFSLLKINERQPREHQPRCARRFGGLFQDGNGFVIIFALQITARQIDRQRFVPGICGQRFLVLAVNGVPVEDLAWKDTVLVPAGAVVDILLDTSNPGDWMLHCHIAEHLSAGMMTHFNVN